MRAIYNDEKDSLMCLCARMVLSATRLSWRQMRTTPRRVPVRRKVHSS